MNKKRIVRCAACCGRGFTVLATGLLPVIQTCAACAGNSRIITS